MKKKFMSKKFKFKTPLISVLAYLDSVKMLNGEYEGYNLLD
jgi:hypothetical protein